MFKAVNIANYFIDKYHKTGDITPLKLIKLVYISHGWHLGLTGKPLIDERVEAWTYGPVVETVYLAYKSHGSSSVHESSTYLRKQDLDNVSSLLDKIWDVYGGYNGLKLSSLTHEKGSPWTEVYISDKNHGDEIPNKLIETYYSNILSENKKSK